MSGENEEFLRRLASRRISRRDLLEIAGKLGLSAAVVGPVLAACGGGGAATPTATETAGATGTPSPTATEGTTATPTATEAAATATATAAALSERERTLVIVYSREGSTIDPATYWETDESTIMAGVYENLIASVWHEEDDSVELVPQLAESWEISPDNLVYTFKLRQGVTFHDGEPYNAQSQKLAYERQMEMNEGPAYMVNDYIEKIETPDDYTFVLTLKKPVATYLQYIAGFWGPSRPISPKALEEHKTADDPWAREWFRGNGVGTGPYKIDEWIPNQQWTLSKYEDYWRGWEGNHMDKVLQRIVPEVSTQRLLLEKGDIDAIVAPLPPEDFKAMEGKPGIVLKKIPAIFLNCVQLHTQRPPTNDINVRRALVHAFDYEAAINSVYGGLAIRNGTTYPKGWEGYREGIELPQKDLEKAKQYLADAGYADGLEMEMVTIEGDEFFRRGSEMYQSDLASIGINVSIRPVSMSTMWDMQASPDTAAQMIYTGWGPDNRDSYSIAYILWHSAFAQGGGANWSFYGNPRVDELLDGVQAEADTAKRIKMYEEIDDIVRADAAWVMVVNVLEGYAFRDYIKGSGPSPTREWSVVPYDVYRG